MFKQLLANLKTIVSRFPPGRMGRDGASKEILLPSTRPLHPREHRRWKRKYVSAEAMMRIIYALDQKRASGQKKILVTDISVGGIKAQANFLSLDDLHVVGNLTESAWMPNILDVELELPISPPKSISFQGRAEWYSKTGAGPYSMIGISISIISKEDREELVNFLERHGV